MVLTTGTTFDKQMLITVTCDQSVTSPTFGFGFAGHLTKVKSISTKSGNLVLWDTGAGAFRNNEPLSAISITPVIPPTISAGDELYLTVLSPESRRLMTFRKQ